MRYDPLRSAFSVMTRQPAIQGGLFFPVTLETKAHLKRYSFEPVYGFYHTMTNLALYRFFNVPFVIEKNMFREIIDFEPRDRCPAVEVLVFLPDFRVIGDHILMTVEALLHRRNPRKGRTSHIGMAELALDILHTSMNPVAEGDGLFRAETRCRVNIEKIEKARKENQAAYGKK